MMRGPLTGFALRSVLSGRHASDRAFGHGGSQSSWAFGRSKKGWLVNIMF